MASRITVYRIEDKESGHGPYTSNWWPGQSALNDAHRSCSEHPVAYFSINLQSKCGEKRLCGSHGLKQLHKWFETRFLQSMADSGRFVVKQFTVPKKSIKTDGYQVCFYEGDAKLVGSFPVSDLIKTKCVV